MIFVMDFKFSQATIPPHALIGELEGTNTESPAGGYTSKSFISL